MDQTEMVLAAYGDERESRGDLVGMCLDKPAGVVNITNMTLDAPTSPGVWRRIGKEINSCWELYPLNVAESIFSTFCEGGSFVEWVDCTANARKRKRDADDCTRSSGSTASSHRVDFETMKEVELSTGIEIDISIVQATISFINYTPTQDPIETGVWWKDDSGKWHSYPEQAVQDIRKAWRRRQHFAILKKVVTRSYPDGVKYIINLTEMEQTNPISGRTRPIKIISNASMPPEVPSSSGGFNVTIFSLGMDLLRGSLQRLLSGELIELMVSKMALAPYEMLAVEPSKHLKDGDRNLLYRKFRLAYETIVKRVPGCCGQLMRLRTHTRELDKEESLSSCASSGETKPSFRHVFYLAPSAEVENILETGLQSCRHIKENFALSTDYYKLHSTTWESPTYSLLLFLVLVPKSSKGSAGLVNAIPVASVNLQLPLAVLTLRNRTDPEPELPGHESGQSGATDSNPFDCTAHNDSCLQVLCSTTAERESVETTTTADFSAQRPLLPSKSKEDMFLLFKLYCPRSERLRFVGGLVVQIGGRSTEILEWLRNIAGFSPDAEIRLYKEDSTKCIDPNSTYGESDLEDGSVVAYYNVLTGKERRSYRCPDLPSFREHIRNRQIVRFRRVSNPTVDDFSLELSSKDTYSDVKERVCQHVGLEDEDRINLYLNDCFCQLPKPLPLASSYYSTLLGDAYKENTSILYFEILDCHPPELDGSKTLTITFNGGDGEKLSVHNIELRNRSTVKDALEKLRGMVKELRNPADAEVSQDPNSTYPNQNSELRKDDNPGSGQGETTQTSMKSEAEIKSLQHIKDHVSALDEKLVLKVVEPSSIQGSSSKCNSPAPMPLAICNPSLSHDTAQDREVSHITVPDPEFHNFDSLRTEKDVIPGQVWAIYDNHDGMPRFYGLITQVCRSPFKVELSWLEPHRKKRWWVETTGISITCGEYEISLVSEIEKQIGVFSHMVLEKAAAVRNMIEVYPRKGEIWAIFSNFDVLHMLGPKPILTPNGIFKQSYEYDIMQMLDDYSAADGVSAVRLVKTEGFKTVFHPQNGPHGTKTYLPPDLRKFSHGIPAEKMDNLATSLPQGAVELDPGSLPVELTVVEGPPGELIDPCSG